MKILFGVGTITKYREEFQVSENFNHVPHTLFGYSYKHEAWLIVKASATNLLTWHKVSELDNKRGLVAETKKTLFWAEFGKCIAKQIS